MELLNSVGHTLWSISQRAYTPGIATVPLILVAALLLARDLRAIPRPTV